MLENNREQVQSLSIMSQGSRCQDKKTNPQLQFHLLLLLQLKQLSQVVLQAMVLTRTRIVPLQAKMFIETTSKTWERFNDLLRACPHHGFSELHQLDTFYNALNVNDQDSLNSAAGGNFLDKMPRECLKIIESKSKVRQPRAKAVVAKVAAANYNQGNTGFRPRWLLTKSDLPVFLPIRITKTISTWETILIKTEEEISTSQTSTHLLSIKATFTNL
nr:reverse transcriptase domain-containing protein [Tanacetum cinerariifolium]